MNTGQLGRTSSCPDYVSQETLNTNRNKEKSNNSSPNYLLITTLNVNGLNASIKRLRLTRLKKFNYMLSTRNIPHWKRHSQKFLNLSAKQKLVYYFDR